MSNPVRGPTLTNEALRLFRSLEHAAQGRVRLRLGVVWEAFLRANPEHALSSEQRPRLHAALQELAGSGLLQLPKGRGWDKGVSPPLPLWVRLGDDKRQKKQPAEHKLYPWAPELRFVATLDRVAHLGELQCINHFLAKGGRQRPMVPLRERSAQLFDDEKKLEQLAQTQLFAKDRLTLTTLRCYAVSPPLVWQTFAQAHGQPVLVVENHHTYHSLCAWNEQRHLYGAIVYGAGKGIERTVESVAAVQAEVGATDARYFGDLDPEGIRIAVRTNARAAEAGYNVRLSPETWLYARLIRAGEGRRFVLQNGRSLTENEANWLPTDVREPALALFSLGLRLPQELVGKEVLDAERD